MLKLLARNVEANLHLFAQDGCPPTSGNSIAAAAAEAAEAMLDDDGDIDGDNNNCAGSACSAEERNMIGRDRHGGDRPGQVAAVRELDWFTFSQEEGPTDSAICPQVGEREKARISPSYDVLVSPSKRRMHRPVRLWWVPSSGSEEGSIARSI